jgi:4-hydroxythreonine-4-phosphate dehydrogenase
MTSRTLNFPSQTSNSGLAGGGVVRLGITIGDPGGIGPEVAMKAIASAIRAQPVPTEPKSVQYVLIGPATLWMAHAALLGGQQSPDASTYLQLLQVLPMIDTFDPGEGQPPEIGMTGPRHGAVALGAIEAAVHAALDGRIDAIVTAPVSKDGLAAAGCKHPGHTEILCDLTNAEESTMLLAGGGLRVALATIHVALRAVPGLISRELILRKLEHLRGFLLDQGISDPRISVCGLNPHAGEKGLFGREEIEVIRPAIVEGSTRGWKVSGPIPADTIFLEMLDGKTDGILAMYHDQGLIPVKTLAFDSAVNITLGLPIIRTSPDHGTAFGIAGKGIASHASFESALIMAEDMVRRRRGTARSSA